MTNKEDVYVYRLGDNLYINLTNRCCNNCTFCLRNNGDGVAGQSLWLKKEPDAQRVIEDIRKADFAYDEAVFCGYGESTYRLGVMLEAAEFLHALGKRVRLNTNGLGDLINGRAIAPELKGRIDKVSISLNESDSEKYERICKPAFGKKAFAAVLEFAKSCQSEGLDTVLTVVDVIGPKGVETCRALCESLGLRLKVRKCITDNVSYT